MRTPKEILKIIFFQYEEIAKSIRLQLRLVIKTNVKILNLIYIIFMTLLLFGGNFFYNAQIDFVSTFKNGEN